MKRTNQVFLGGVLVLVGVVLALNAFGITGINLFFDGWWTLFIIIPCIKGLISGRDTTGNLIGLGIGIFLLLCCQNILDFGALWKLVFPAIVILFGLKMIFGGRVNNEAIRCIEFSSGGTVRHGTAVFSSEKMTFNGEVFEGAGLNAVFGGVECDLRNAIIQQDTCLFGGVDIQ